MKNMKNENRSCSCIAKKLAALFLMIAVVFPILGSVSMTDAAEGSGDSIIQENASDQEAPAAATEEPSGLESSHFILEESPKVTEDYIIMYDHAAFPDEVKEELNTRQVKRNKKVSSHYAEFLGMLLVKLSETEAAALEHVEGVRSIEKDMPMYGSQETSPDSPDWDQELYPILEPSYTEFNIAEIMNTPAEEFSSNPYEYHIPPAITDGSGTEVLPWNVEMVAGDPRTRTYRGAGVKVAVIDSGIDNHDDLDTAGWVDFSDTVYGFKPTDNCGHGSAVAGVIYARVSGFGIVGIASDADVYSVKVLDEDNRAMVSSVIQAIEWCIQNDMDIINMSFGMNESSAALKYAIDRAEETGILMIAAAGNSGGALQYPAAYENVIGVGAVDESAQPAQFTCAGDGLDFTAPGVNVHTTTFLGAYYVSSGTSYSAAHVTGVATVLKGIDTSRSNEFIIELMRDSAYKPGFEEWDEQYGYGIVSLERALALYAERVPQLGLPYTSDDAPDTVPVYEINGEFTEENGFFRPWLGWVFDYEDEGSWD